MSLNKFFKVNHTSPKGSNLKEDISTFSTPQDISSDKFLHWPCPTALSIPIGSERNIHISTCFDCLELEKKLDAHINYTSTKYISGDKL